MKKVSHMAFGQELIKVAEDHDFLVFNADTKSCGIENFGKLYPGRGFTFGIAEQNLISAASGAASCGNKVFLATFAVFASMRACEQVRTFLCYPNLDVTILATHGGLKTGEDGATHIALEDLGIMRSIPNLTIVEPSDFIAAEKLVHLSMDYHTPLYIRFPKAATEQIHDPEKYEMEIGKANVIRQGTDVTLFAMGWILSRAIEAAEELSKQNISAEVIEIHTLKPIDKDVIISSATHTGAAVTIEDHSIIGGLGSAVSEILSEKMPTPLKRIGVNDCFGESGNSDLLYEKHGMTVSDIVNAAKEIIKRKK